MSYLLERDAKLAALLAQGLLEEISDSPSEALLGLALLTDDDVSTLFAVTLEADVMRSADDPDVRFVPTEWTQSVDSRALAAASELLQDRARRLSSSAEAFAARDRDFAALVDAVQLLRGRGRVPESAYMTVTSTDPGPHSAAIARDALLKLNAAGPIRSWRDWRLTHARGLAAQLQMRTTPLSYAEQDALARARAEIAELSES